MTVRAIWNEKTLAESDRTILVEGNHYFPPDDVSTGALEPSETVTHCSWKGNASYYNVVVDGMRVDDAAWYYPHPYGRASAISGYVAFWKGVRVTGENIGEREIEPPIREPSQAD
jgi:uncharacterized protein (DUF427 family)